MTRSGDTTAAGSVDFAVTSGAADGADFGGTLPGGTVSFLAGETSQVLTIDVTGDTDFEGDEDFTVTLSNPSSGSAITTPSADGTIQNDDPAPPIGSITLIDESFDSGGDTGPFTYSDGSFGGDNPQAYADGSWDSGALRIDLGGGDNANVTDISGGWTADFTLAAESEVTLSFLYELLQASDYESDEFSQLLVSIDGNAPIEVDSLIGDGNGGPTQTTGPQSFNLLVGVLAAGDHSLTIGGFNNKKTWNNESTTLTIDDVTLVAAPTAPPIPIESSFSIAPLDAVKNEGDSGTTQFTFTVTRSGDLSEAASVDFGVAGTGATPAAGDDFPGGLLPNGNLDFLSGQDQQTLVIEVLGDGDFEADEGFTVTLANPSPGSDIIVAAADGTVLNDDAAPVGPMILVDANFDTNGDTEGFLYSDGVFGGPASQSDASGTWSNGALVVDLGGGDNSAVLDLSGAWEISFVLAADMEVALSFSYELIMASEYESNEFGQVLVSLDNGPAILVDELFGDGNGGADQTTGLQSANLNLGNLSAGGHSLAIGAYNNQKTWSNESTELTIDDVLITANAPAAASAQPGGVDGSLQGLVDQADSDLDLQTIAGL